jgi:hypothetical protein
MPAAAWLSPRLAFRWNPPSGVIGAGAGARAGAGAGAAAAAVHEAAWCCWEGVGRVVSHCS